MSIHDFDGLARKFEQLSKGTMETVIRNIVEVVGEALLSSVTDEIDKQALIDTGTMWNSFTRGGGENVWVWDVDRNTITLEVGSNIPYARYINDGYTVSKPHFVPGYWNSGGSFVFDRGAKTGFMARPRTFIGRQYFDIAVRELEGGMNALIMKRLEKEMGRLFA